MSVKNDFAMPIIVLACICFFVSGALAFVNGLTQPIIERSAAMRAWETAREIMPHAEDFELLEIESFRSASGLPETIIAVLETTNDVGYIFMIATNGYGGEIRLVCGIDPDGKIIRTAVMAHSETIGFGTPIFEEPYSGQFWGRDKDGIEGIAGISGATITSNAFKNGIRDAFTAFEIVAAKGRGAR